MAITGQIVVPRLATWCALYLDDERGEPDPAAGLARRTSGSVEDLRNALREDPRPTSSRTPSDALLAGELHDAAAAGSRARDRAPGAGPAGRQPAARRRTPGDRVDRPARGPGHRQRPGARRPARDRTGTAGQPAAAVPARRARARGGRGLRGGGRGDRRRRRLLRHLPGRRAAPGASWSATSAAPAPRPPRSPASPGTPSARSLAPGFPVAPTLERLNAAILDEGERARFLTLVCGMFRQEGRPGPDQPGQRRTPRAVRDQRRQRAGTPDRHAPAAARRHRDRSAYVAEEHVLERGELLVALTDGVLERRDGGLMLDDQRSRPPSSPGSATLPAAGGRRAAAPARGRVRRLTAERRHRDPRAARRGLSALPRSGASHVRPA